ncbi:MAG: methylenetetrahydrofolate reductase [NAD(P)H] [Pseudomonadota bacterium]
MAPSVSFEFFPPRTLEASFKLWETVQSLACLDPTFVSVTYGAGGTTRDLTRDAVKALHGSAELNVAAHLTCVDASKTETLEIAEEFAKAGVREIVALRGDPPKGETQFMPHPDGFNDACELISALADMNRFKIRVGAYPEVHPEAASMQANIDWLKRKIDAGGDEAITQFFFEPDTFFRFRDACGDAGITAPIIPGILPIENWKGTTRFAHNCGATVPGWLSDAFGKAERDGREDLLATAVATELCAALVDGGVEHLHFYTLNKPEMTRDICMALGLRPRVSLRQVA